MNKFISFFLFFVFFTSTAVWSDDYDKAFEASQNGNYELAIRLWYPLALEGDVDTIFNIGYILANGFGDIPQDFIQAETWLSIAAQEYPNEDGTIFLGHPNAQYLLGLMYMQGLGVPQDYKISSDFFRQAASQGFTLAQHNLAKMYFDGQGVDKDYKTAVDWWAMAAEAGQKEAQFSLATMYMNGRGVKKDNKLAFKWNKLAAEQGVPDAQINLGVWYGEGIEVPKNLVQALMWILVSELSGDNREVLISGLKNIMSVSEIAEAEKLAELCKLQNYKNCQSEEDAIADGLVHIYYPNGQLKSETHYKNKKMHGKFTMWSENGQKLGESFLKNDKLHGRLLAWHANGQLWQDTYFKNGKEHGELSEWDEDGKFIGKSIFKKGKCESGYRCNQ